MIKKVISAIAIALNQTFGDDYDIYTEPIEQGFEGPCFSIVCVEPVREQRLGNSYIHSNIFCVHYLTDENTAEKRAECYSIADTLTNALEYITVDKNLVRGTKMHSEFSDGLLHFFVNYDTYSRKVIDKIPMENIESNPSVKG